MTCNQNEDAGIERLKLLTRAADALEHDEGLLDQEYPPDADHRQLIAELRKAAK
jgi:hypothetical protein